MKPIFSSICLILFLGALPALAQRHETFAERPSKRQEKVKAARERARREKEEARQWAKARGLKMRHDDGKRVMELMAIRNGHPIYYTTHNDDAAISTSANLVRDTTPFNVNGSNITVGVWDAGSILATHREFDGRVANLNSVSSHYHATHVGGTIGAAGISASAEGMAPNVELDSYDWNDDISEMTARAASSSGDMGKIYLSNHSYGIIRGWVYFNTVNSWSGNIGWHWSPWLDWGSGEVDTYFGQYDQGAADYDGIVSSAPYYLPFVSAGNDRNDTPSGTVYYSTDGGTTWGSATYNSSSHPLGDGVYKAGYDCISAEATAKNIMTVGAVNDAVSGSLRSTNAATMSSFSCWGPSDDGRIKPDIVANGVDLYSCDNDHNADYYTMSGTSMSSPNACGSAALLVDYYDDLFPGQAMRASTLKGLIIHTADDLGRPGPDYCYGWGLMNTLAAAELLKDFAINPDRMMEATLTASHRTDTYTFFSDASEPVRVTLCWTDPSGDVQYAHDSRISVLENDLDLKVEGPDGTFWPYSLDFNNPSSNATANSENIVDNVEQVYIAAPEAGQYTVTVDYDGSLAGGSSPQYYSLLISGPSVDSDSDGMPDHWETTHFSSPTGAVATADSDGDGADNLTEYISGYDPTDSNSVFKVTSFTVPESGSSPFIITWNPVEGRLYSVDYASGLVYPGFDGILGATNLPYTQNSYTDTVERTSQQNFYRVDVRLEQ
ncbi:MAG: S8 family serine peptidase [Verrucomicrobiota bacterium]